MTRGKTVTRSTLTALASSLALLLAQSGASASGFGLPEISAAGVATTNALVANPDETGAFAYNPAAMGFHDKTSVSLGGMLIGPTFEVETSTGKHESDGADWIATGFFQAAIKASPQWTIGFGVNSPMGLENRWEEGTFPKLSGNTTVPLPPPLGPTPLPNGSHPTDSKLQIVDFVPTVTYRVNDNLSLSGGIDLYWVKDAVLNSSLGKLDGDGTGLGFNLSALYVRDALSVGAAFRSSSTVNVEGRYRPLNPTLVMLGAALPAQGASVDVNLPWRLQLGVRYEIKPEWAVEFDWTRTGWSTFDKLVVNADQTGGTIFQDVNNWDDADAFRFATTYQLLPQTQLRFGYTYDKTPQGDDHFSARVPDNDRHLFGIGVAHELADGLSLEFGYLYVRNEQRNFRSSKPYEGLGGEINGTDALDGKYQTDANLIAFELRKYF